MKKRTFLFSMLVLGMSMTFTACGSDGDDTPATDKIIDDAEYDPIISQYVDQIVLPTYSELASKNQSLLEAVNTFAATPSDANFVSVCDAWMEARRPWESSEAFLFGPVDSEGLDPNMDSWPLDQEGIKGILVSGDWSKLNWDEETSDNAVEAAQSLRGFHTLEFFAFYNGEPRTVTAVASSENPADIQYNNDAANWKSNWTTYMKRVASLLASDAKTLYDDWSVSFDGGESFASRFKMHMEGDYKSGINCIEQIIDGCADIASEVGETKIGDPVSKEKSGNHTEAIYAVESWYSWHSRDDYTNNIISIRNSYYGNLFNGGPDEIESSSKNFETVSSNSLSALVAKYNPALDNQVKNAIKKAAVAIQAIPQPFRDHILCEETEAAMEACAELEDILTNQLKPYLVNSTKLIDTTK